MKPLRVFFCVCLLSLSARAAFDPDERAARSVVPMAVREKIQAGFPGFSLPASDELTGRWGEFRTHYAWLPYLAAGDFNGDGQTDYATLLVGASEWKIVIFQAAEGGAYTPVLIRSGDLPGSGAYSYPRALRLRTIQKGQAYGSESGDSLVQMAPNRDVIELHDDNKGTWLLQYANGRYTDFLWNRSAFPGSSGNNE